MRNKEPWPKDKFLPDVTDELHSTAATNVEFTDQPKQKTSAIISYIKKDSSLMNVLKISLLCFELCEHYSLFMRKPSRDLLSN